MNNKEEIMNFDSIDSNFDFSINRKQMTTPNLVPVTISIDTLSDSPILNVYKHNSNKSTVRSFSKFTDNEFNDIEANYYNTNKNMDFLRDNNDIQDNYIHSNSPLTISANNSDDEVVEVHTEVKSDKIRFKKKGYEDIEKSLVKYYEYDNKYSSKLDILISFMKVQKNVYMQSNYITHNKFFTLMIPAVILSTVIAIIAPLIHSNYWAGGFISSINITITSLLTIINYTKYEIYAEKYLQIANQYDKIDFSLEMTNSKLLFINDDSKKNELVLEKLKEIENKINELKEFYNILIPQSISNLYPIICNINIFSLIKKLELHKRDLINKFKDVKNEISYILYKWKNDDSNNIESLKDKSRLLFLYEIKEKIKVELSHTKNVYDVIELLFMKEMKNAETYKKHQFYYWFMNKKVNIKKEDLHPILEKYFDFIFQHGIYSTEH